MLPQDLVEQATKVSGEGITPTIRRGLEEVIRTDAYEAVRAMRGKVKFSLDFDELRRNER